MLYGFRRSVVWEVRGEHELVLLPIIVSRKFWRHDVLLSLADLVACGGSVAHSVIRPLRNEPSPRRGEILVGEVPGGTMCRVVHGVVRAIEEARIELRLGDERRHRIRVFGERCVNTTR